MALRGAEATALGRALASGPSGAALGACQGDAVARVLVINTGGTISMVPDDKGLTPEANKLVSSLKNMPQLHDEAYAQEKKLYDCHEYPDKTLVLPTSKQNKRIIYTILELSPLLDSSNMTPEDWAKIARKLEEHYEKYDGFVILHGTDTMAYTASALSFMFENLGKTVVMTGSQVPLYELRNDGRANLLGALLFAGQFVIPEVCLYFYNKLYRGNRVTKVDAGSFNAFSSPNLPPLANAEVDIKNGADSCCFSIMSGSLTALEEATCGGSSLGALVLTELARKAAEKPTAGVRRFESSLFSMEEQYRAVLAPQLCIPIYIMQHTYQLNSLRAQPVQVRTVNWDTVWRANTKKRFRVHTNMNRNVGLLRIFPGITAAAVKAFLQPPIEGIVLETYGSGNAPNNRADLLQELKKATEREVVILNCTQCLRGSVTTVYATGQTLADVGIIPGGDMTPEAALAKLSYTLSKCELTWEEKRQMLSENLRGEMTVVPTGDKISLRDSKFIQVIAKSLSISCKEELEAVRDALLPPLACAAAKLGDIDALRAIKEMGGNLSCEDYDGRTPLHIAASEGHLPLVEYLLMSGATVYARDRYGSTPLTNAIQFRRMEVINLLRETGAHLSSHDLENTGTILCSLAAKGDVEGLYAWYQAGADLQQAGYDGKNALQVAKATGHTKVLDFFRH